MNKSKLLTNILLITILMTIGFGCNSAKLPSFGGGLSESTDPKAAIQDTLKNFTDAKSYHSVIKTKNALAEVETEVSFVAPDKFSIKNNVPTMKSEIIVIGNESFSRMGDGKWTKLPPNQGPSIADIRGKYSEESLAAMRDFTFVGKETINKRDALIFKYNTSYGGEAVCKMWIDANSSLPIKVETDGIYANNKVQMTVTYDFEKEITIEAPKTY